MQSRVFVWGLLACLVLAGCGSDGSDGTGPSGNTTSSGGQAPSGGTSGAPAGGNPGTSGTAGGTTPSGGNTGTSGNAGNAAGSNGTSGGATGGTSAGGTTNTAGSGGTISTGGTGGSTSAGSGGTGPKFHVFLLLGQSNMAGYPKATDADKMRNERIKVLGFDDCAATGRQLDKWDVAVPPLHECWNGAIGPGDYFAKTLIEKLPAGDTIGLVPGAISGEKIETFLKVGGTKYNSLVQRAKLAQQAGGVIEGILFHQGESNNGDASWPGKVNTLVSDLRTDLGLGNVPFLAGELAYDGGCAGHNTLVAKLPMAVSNAHVVSASGLSLDPADSQWRLHFGRDAQITFGQRYAAKMIEALGW